MHKQLFIGILAMLTISMVSAAQARDQGRYRIVDPDLGYDAYICPSRTFIMMAPDMFFKVYGRWPVSFSEIHDAGMIRSNLSIDGEYIITPDDGVFNSNEDVTYYPATASSTPVIASRGQIPVAFNDEKVHSTPGIGAGIARPDLDESDTWDGFSQRNIQSLSEHNEGGRNDKLITKLSNRLGNRDLQKLLSIAEMCTSGLNAYKQCNGRFPKDWSEFVDTGFCPVSSDMLNPVTRKPFATDGSPYSFDFRTSDSGTYVAVLGENGEAL